VTSPDVQSLAPSQGTGPEISNRIQNVRLVETEPVIDEKQLLSLPIEELRKQGETRLNPKILLFKGAVLEGQLSSQEMQAARGKTVGQASEDIASVLVNSAVDNSAL
jgi:hypothetical protein